LAVVQLSFILTLISNKVKRLFAFFVKKKEQEIKKTSAETAFALLDCS